MIDEITQKPLSVTTSPEAPPHLVVPLAQLDRVTALLDAHRVSYWGDEEALSMDGKPEIIFINLNDETDAVALQSLLDSIP